MKRSIVEVVVEATRNTVRRVMDAFRVPRVARGRVSKRNFSSARERRRATYIAVRDQVLAQFPWLSAYPRDGEHVRATRDKPQTRSEQPIH